MENVTLVLILCILITCTALILAIKNNRPVHAKIRAIIVSLNT